MPLLAFGAALRRSELVALTLGYVETIPGRGLMLTIARSKADQVGADQHAAMHANPAEPSCWPAAALAAWLHHRRAGEDRGARHRAVDDRLVDESGLVGGSCDVEGQAAPAEQLGLHTGTALIVDERSFALPIGRPRWAPRSSEHRGSCRATVCSKRSKPDARSSSDNPCIA
jgi:hypothetical protein